MVIDDTMARAMELLEKSRRLPRDLKIVFEYFYKNLSVGDLRAVKELTRMGVRDPQDKIDKLVEEGLIEKGLDCYNLAKPLREYIYRRGRL
ncbi:MAG: hypothetical protein F7C38_03375 [Desulfurococcales archaeon]|nr:hypothetical protein [Desulfurococcales archaeon]